jgi:predicted short-subunit dehydrogenase-like oxidoreductase (DUF2520 family)
MLETVAIVGAGRVGRALGRRLHELGWGIGAVVACSSGHARAAVRAIGAGTPHVAVTRRVLGADLILIAVPDRAIRSVAADLARIGSEEWRGKVVLHTSGALDRRALRPLARCGASTGSLHPLQTFGRQSAPQLEGVIFAVEGDQRARRLAVRICRALGGVAIRVDGAHKPAYHAAGAMVAGHLLGLVEAATRILMKLGFTHRMAVRALLPLTRQTLDNFERLGPAASWTGPVARGDFETVARHAAALRNYPKEFRSAYLALARLSGAVLARDPGATVRQLRRALRTR